MGSILMVKGQAGTGKTTWLLSKAKELAPEVISEDYQNMLVLTRMHGARRRLELDLSKSCPDINCYVSTIDGFALTLLNKWRLSLGYNKPISPSSEAVDLKESFFEIEASFNVILKSAVNLLKSETVGKIIEDSYPLILVDEFQDCHDLLLEFVLGLGKLSNVLLAADDFQLLEPDLGGCPATECIQELAEANNAEVVELHDIHRTQNSGILEAARCLRENKKSDDITVPVICCPDYGPMAWNIFIRLIGYNPRLSWKGSSVIICPVHDTIVNKIIESLNRQIAKNNKFPIKWHIDISTEKETEQILKHLNIGSSSTDDSEWIPPGEINDATEIQVANNVQRISRLRGLEHTPEILAKKTAKKAVHNKRAYSLKSAKRTITTVHGAKNREFDNVYVVWPYRVPSNAELQRRWLYNAVTRAKHNCIVLAQGDQSKIAKNTILCLLGPPQPAFPPRKKKRQAKSQINN